MLVGRLTKRKKYDKQKKPNNISQNDEKKETKLVIVLDSIAKVFPKHFQFQSSPVATRQKLNKKNDKNDEDEMKILSTFHSPNSCVSAFAEITLSREREEKNF